jgi:CubicO group peptidase (beta-lactamase class C family)
MRESSLDPEIVEKGVREILAQKFPRVQSLVVAQHGRLVLDEYFQGFGPQDIHQLESGSKTIFSILFGIAQDQGLVRTEQKLYDFFPEYRGKPGWVPDKAKITLGNLLSMTSGFACDDWVPATDCHLQMVKTPDWLDFVLNQPMDHVPGEHWAYCNDCLEPLGAILARQSGMGVPDFAQKYLFGPLGFQNPYWSRFPPKDLADIAGSISLRPRDMAKVGQLVLHKGQWGDRQIVSEKWLETSTQFPAPIPPLAGWCDGYGYLWWRRDMPLKDGKVPVVFAAGLGGQYIFIVPKLDLVCVMTGGNYDDYRSQNFEQEFFKAFILGAAK